MSVFHSDYWKCPFLTNFYPQSSVSQEEVMEGDGESILLFVKGVEMSSLMDPRSKS